LRYEQDGTDRPRSAPGSAAHRFGGLLAIALVLAVPATAGERFDLETSRETAIYATGGALALGALVITDHRDLLSDDEIAALDPADVPGLDRFATRQWSPAAGTASDVLAYGLIASPALLYTQTGSAMGAGDLTVMYTQTMLVQMGTVGLLKHLVGRVRPFVYNDDPRIPAELKRSKTAVMSFPSGHTANAFAGAVFSGEVFARLNPDDPARHWVRGGTLVLAAATGWFRIKAGRHFTTDVLAGAAIGALVGWAVPKLHEVDPPAGGDKARPAPGFTVAFSF
jgi:membrane-associated phospholipid phosphatase